MNRESETEMKTLFLEIEKIVSKLDLKECFGKISWTDKTLEDLFDNKFIPKLNSEDLIPYYSAYAALIEGASLTKESDITEIIKVLIGYLPTKDGKGLLFDKAFEN